MKQIISIICLFAALISCRQNSSSPVPAVESTTMNNNGIYFWKTRFNLNDYELDFLRKHEISRIYVKMFDVALQNESPQDTLSLIPIATTRFECPFPEDIEIIPTVYITYEALSYLNAKDWKVVKSYTDRILTRIYAMSSFHEINHIKEVQFDCDWTSGTYYTYQSMCEHAKYQLNKKGIQFSITLRLHQMHLPGYYFPHADRGVLMLYNTGAFKNPNTVNSILTYNDAEPYIRRHEVPFPVDYAYPTYSWSLLFRNDKFKCIVRNVDLTDSTLFQKSDYNKFTVRKDTLIGNLELMRGDIIRHEESDFKEIERVKSDLSRSHDMKNSRHIIYHLDSTNLSNYTDDEIKYMLLAY